MVRFLLVFLIPTLCVGTQAGDAPRQVLREEKSQNAGPREDRAENARTVLNAIVKAAGENHRLPQRDTPGARAPYRRTGDELTVHYVRIAATAARRLPDKEAASAFLLALGIALDDSPMLRTNVLTRGLWLKIEPADAHKKRLDVLGEPMLHGRHDLAQHFSVSAALTVIAGPQAAERAGVLKEQLDSNGGSGFSFADLSADFAGIAFARRLLEKPSLLTDIERNFRVEEYAIPPRGLPEGLTAKEFSEKYGSLKDERYLRMQEHIRKRIAALPGYGDKKRTEDPHR